MRDINLLVKVAVVVFSSALLAVYVYDRAGGKVFSRLRGETSATIPQAAPASNSSSGATQSDESISATGVQPMVYTSKSGTVRIDDALTSASIWPITSKSGAVNFQNSETPSLSAVLQTTTDYPPKPTFEVQPGDMIPAVSPPKPPMLFGSSKVLIGVVRVDDGALAVVPSINQSVGASPALVPPQQHLHSTPSDWPSLNPDVYAPRQPPPWPLRNSIPFTVPTWLNRLDAPPPGSNVVSPILGPSTMNRPISQTRQ